jgi:hypothetical protein
LYWLRTSRQYFRGRSKPRTRRTWRKNKGNKQPRMQRKNDIIVIWYTYDSNENLIWALKAGTSIFAFKERTPPQNPSYTDYTNGTSISIWMGKLGTSPQQLIDMVKLIIKI